MSQLQQPGDISVTTALLFNFTKSASQDISEQISSIDIYESIFSPVIFAEIMMIDSINLHEKFPIRGEEWIVLQCSSPGMSKEFSLNLTFRIIRKTNLSVEDQGRISTYKLVAVSEEFQTNAKASVRKTFSDMPINNMVENLLTNNQFLNTKKKVRTDGGETKGKQTIMIPNLNPLQTIDFLRQRAVSKNYTTSAFVFFENKKGFNFTNLEYLFEIGKKTQSSNPVFFFKSTGNIDVDKAGIEQARNIISYRHIMSGDPVTSANRGGFHNKVINYDLRTATFTEVSSKKTNISQKAQYGDTRSIHTSSSLNKELEENTPASTTLFVTNSMKPPTFREDAIGSSKIYVEQLVQNIVRVFVAGDTSLTAGKMVVLNLPQFRGTTEDGDQSRKSKYVSGNYIISKIRHTLIRGGRWQHGTVMECVKGEFGSV